MEYKFIKDGTITTPKGFTAGGVCCSIKEQNKTKKDLMMVKSDTLCNAAAIFTKNLVKSDAVKVTKEHLLNGKAQGIIANSGNANTCNADGREKALKMCFLCANALSIDENDVIVASTGVIGQILPIEPIEKGVSYLKDNMTVLGGSDAAEAIMTTDTVKKEIALEFTLDGKKVTIGGIAKGSGMIHINMGTMLSFITTDASISSLMLKEALKEAADESYNMVSVDGDTSTNDTLAIMANGKAGNREIIDKDDNYRIFVTALTEAFRFLSKALAKDGEGATKLLVAKVSNAKTKKDARAVAKSVICSSLLKAAMFGADANWGRVLCAIGYSGADVDIDKVSVSFKSEKGEIAVCKNGVGIDFSEEKAKEILLMDEIEILIDLCSGKSYAEAYGCDLTYDYVKINGDYRT
ncbi:MAG: bifunctional glutamate N-acetyltransferase/amino-acid acetyltransferase ArgJ [Acutalibacteraceae bacterium]